MRKKRALITIRKYPWLLDSSFQLTNKQADELILKANLPALNEMIEDAKKKHPHHREKLCAYDVIGQIYTSEKRSSNARHLLRYGLAFIIVIALLFFTIVPAGRGLAKRFFKMLVWPVETEIRYDTKEKAMHPFIDDGFSNMKNDDAGFDDTVTTEYNAAEGNKAYIIQVWDTPEMNSGNISVDDGCIVQSTMRAADKA